MCVNFNLLKSGCPGCHVVDENSDWIRSVENLSKERIYQNKKSQKVKKIDLVLENSFFSVSNFENSTQVVYASIMLYTTLEQSKDLLIFIKKNGGRLEVGETSPPSGYIEECWNFERKSKCPERLPCLTFVITIQPTSTICIAKSFLTNDDVLMFNIEFKLEDNPLKNEAPLLDLEFPLINQNSEPYLCTQGFGGRLTHFFTESYHAIDLRCKEGTQILAVVDGVIKKVEDNNTITGIHCFNLFAWNALSLVTSDGQYSIEYVHIEPGSAVVKEGDKVKAGDIICKSGKVGFAPEPHLHLEVHSCKNDRSSIPFKLKVDAENSGFIPCAGKYYNSKGEVELYKE